MKISLAYNNKTKNVFWNTMYFKYYIDYVTLELIIAIFGVFGHLKYYTPLPFFSLMASNISCKVFQSSKGSFWNIKKEILASSTAQYYNNKLRPVWIWFVFTVFGENLIRFLSWMDLVLSVNEIVFLNDLIFSYQKLNCNGIKAETYHLYFYCIS